MLPNLDINILMATLLGDDSTTYNAGIVQNILRLVSAGPTPSPSVVPGDVTFADAVTGLSPASVPQLSGAVIPGLDPSTQNILLTIQPAVGGFVFRTDGTFVPSLTIIGFMLTNDAGTKNLGYALFDTPYVLSGPSQEINVTEAQITLIASALS